MSEPPPPKDNQPPKQPAVIKPQWQYQSGQLSQKNTINPSTGPSKSDLSKSASDTETVKWTASEFISHEKSRSWYVYLALIAVAIAAAFYFLTKDIFSVVVVGLVMVVMGVFGSLKPRTLDYGISPDGIQIGNKNFTFETFRSFSVMDDSPLPSIQLLPQKRFMVPIVMYFDPKDADHIVKILGDYLPFEHRERDLIDKLSSRLRF